MHIATSEAPRESDLTARARIREAAIACFANEGFDASFRMIAERAGVSPGLITHHFGSKGTLRAECDAEVLRRSLDLKAGGLADPSASLLNTLMSPDVTAPLLVYVLRAIQAGGRPAQEFLEHLVDSTREVMKASVESGFVRPSRDEEARLRYLTYQAIGTLLVRLLTMPHATTEEFIEAAVAGQRSQILPTLELYTEGLLTTRQMLDDYLLYVGDPPSEEAQPDVASA